MAPFASMPCPMILQPQWSQTGAIAWMAHSKLSNTWVSPPRVISIVLSYSLPHTSHWGISSSLDGSSLRYPEKHAQFVEHPVGSLEDVVVSEAAKLVASRPGFPLSAAVELPGVAGAVVAVAVELDGQALLGPAAVDSVAARFPVGVRERQARLLQALEEGAFEGTEGDALVAAEHPSQVVGAGGVGPPLRTASTCFGVVPYLTPASWQARARSGNDSNEARSTSVLGTVVTGMRATMVPSR